MASKEEKIESEVFALNDNGFEVDIKDGNLVVYFTGPANCCYAPGRWAVKVNLPEDFPNKPLAMSFENPPYHPNIEDPSRRICMDELLEQNWNAAEFDLVTVFNTLLPRLLLFPNPEDPLNFTAAQDMCRDPNAFRYVVEAHSLMVAVEGGDEGQAARVVDDFYEKMCEDDGGL